MISMLKRANIVLSLTIVCACVTGCSRGLSPETRGLGLTKDEAHENYRLTKNQNGRSGSDDVARFFYTDSPSRLTPYPIVTTGGMPR